MPQMFDFFFESYSQSETLKFLFFERKAQSDSKFLIAHFFQKNQTFLAYADELQCPKSVCSLQLTVVRHMIIMAALENLILGIQNDYAHLNIALEVFLILCGEVAFFIQFFFTKVRWVPENSIVGHENCDNKNIEDRADIC